MKRRILEVNGQSRTIAEWSRWAKKELGIDLGPQTIGARIKLRWPARRIVSEPPLPRKGERARARAVHDLPLLDRASIRGAIDSAKGDLVLAAKALKVSCRHLNRRIASLRMRSELYDAYGQPPRSRAEPGGRHVASRRAKWYARNGASAPIVKAQLDSDEHEFLSLVGENGDMVTVRFAARREIEGMVDMLRRHRKEGDMEEEQIVAEIQVTSAAQKDRLARIEKAVRRFCPEIADKILAE